MALSRSRISSLRIRKPAEVVEVELDQLRLQLQKELKERKREARRKRRMRRRCRLQAGEKTQAEAMDLLGQVAYRGI